MDQSRDQSPISRPKEPEPPPREQNGTLTPIPLTPIPRDGVEKRVRRVVLTRRVTPKAFAADDWPCDAAPGRATDLDGFRGPTRRYRG